MIYSPERTRILNEWIKVLAEFYRGDETFRAWGNSGGVAEEVGKLGAEPASGTELQVVTKHIRHIVMPLDPNAVLTNETLIEIACGPAIASSAGAAVPGRLSLARSAELHSA